MYIVRLYVGVTFFFSPKEYPSINLYLNVDIFVYSIIYSDGVLEKKKTILIVLEILSWRVDYTRSNEI